MIGSISFLWSGVPTIAELHSDGWRHGLPEVVAMLETIAPHDGEEPLYAAMTRLGGAIDAHQKEVTDAGA
jgi:hypothetical protein